MPWNEEMDKICRAGAAQKLSAAQIAVEIGKQTGQYVTRNAVIGYTHRKGVDLSKGVVRRPRCLGPVMKRRSKIPTVPQSSMLLVAPTKTHRERARINFGLLAEKPLSILALAKETCRWPLWPHEGQTPVDQMFYCGTTIDGESAYCHSHHAQSLPGSEPTVPRSNLSLSRS